MKGRSHRPPAAPAAPMDDWLDGSWTVDCPCGVTFDDGEEMVKCDECGVWVHTRCTRFVKEEASFTCDKCKPRRSLSPVPTNIEETEVAQLLAELPTKADSCPPPPPPPPPAPPSFHRTAFRRWAERPMEEKVHVQGIPGGDPALFAGLSTIFSQELWKCTGYVPKKFNFRYREFPCWDDEESDSPSNAGADLLFSLSKEGVAAGVVTEPAECLPSAPKGLKGRDGKGLLSEERHKFARKERSKFRGAGLHSGKRRNEDPIGIKDGAVKKIRISASSHKNRGVASRLDGRNLGIIRKEIFRGADKEVEKTKQEDKRVEKRSGSSGNLVSEEKQGSDNPKNSSSVKNSSGISAIAASMHKLSPEVQIKAKKVKVEASVSNANISRTDGSAKSFVVGELSVEPSIKKEDSNTDELRRPSSGDLMNINGGSSNTGVGPRELERSIGDLANASCILPLLTVVDPSDVSSNEPLETKSKEDVISDSIRADVDYSVTHISTATVASEPENVLPDHPPRPGVLSSIGFQTDEIGAALVNVAPKLQAAESEHVMQPLHARLPVVASGSPELKKHTLERESPERIEKALELQHTKGSAREPTMLGSLSPDNITTPGHKLAIAIGKSALASNTDDVPRLPISDSYKSPGTTSSSSAARTVPFTKRVKVSTISKKEIVKNGLDVEGNMHGGTSQQSKGSGSSADPSLEANKATHQSLQGNKTIHGQSSKQKPVDSQEAMSCSPRISSIENPATLPMPGRLGGPTQTQSTSVQTKVTLLDSGSKNTRTSSPSSQPSYRADYHPTTMHSPSPLPPSIVNTTTATITLSDEELAKRLHHELNSSPRVSRVPRGLQVGGILSASSTSASMLSKRSSSAGSGGKIQVVVSRRKNKEDTIKDAPHFREVADKTENLEDLSSHKKQSESSHKGYSIKKDTQKGSHNNLSSTKESGQLTSVAGLTYRTLPGLIDEIMNEGKPMTYKELCDAVLPYWPILKKPNGEQYGYSSHSEAVLDCLRNRNEWAHLVDYEPKTYTSKKRSKSNQSQSSGVSENGKANSRMSAGQDDKNGESCLENLPKKGKRLARKRRKLMLKGRAVQRTRGREIGDEASDDDLGSYSGAEGSQSFSSKDEIQGSRRCKNTSGLTASSEEESD